MMLVRLLIIVAGVSTGFALSGQSALLTALKAPNVSTLLEEDARRGGNRFAAPIEVGILVGVDDLNWQAGSTYRYTREFVVPGASGLALLLDQVKLPDAATLIFHSPAGFTRRLKTSDVSAEGRIHTGFAAGSTVTLTYTGPLPNEAPFRINRVDHVYRPDLWSGPNSNKDFGDANDCQINAACDTEEGWEDAQASTARINLVVEEGVGFCTGNLIANTANDGRPLLLTGFHCIDGFTPLYDLWRVDFDYAATTCEDPTTEPARTTYTGVARRAGLRETDFLLLEIQDVEFAAEEHFFAGWDVRRAAPAGPVTHFHHPAGDVRKIGRSTADGAPVLNRAINWNTGVITPASHHFIMAYGLGSFQPGSSGSAFFNEDGLIIGQLNGGLADCAASSLGYIGRLSLSYDTGTSASERLREWLDPLGRGDSTWIGSYQLTSRYVTGVVRHRGTPVSGAEVTFHWSPDEAATFTTGANGTYRGERPPLGMAFTVTASYGENLDIKAGVNVGDIITIRRGILGLSDPTPEELLASDVNGSGSVSVTDITRLTRVILGVGTWRDRPNWLAVPEGFPLTPLPRNPAAPIPITLNRPGDREIKVDFYLLKTGDADMSFEP